MQWNKATMAMEMPANELVHFSEPCSLSIIYTNRKTPLLQTELPGASWLSSQADYDYNKSYLTTYKSAGSSLEPADLMAAFLKATPFCFRLLLATKKQPDAASIYEALKNNFYIVQESNNEIVFEVRHKHLNYKFSLLQRQFRRTGILKNLFLSTTVTFHNPVSRFYFMMIKPLYEYALETTLKKMVLYIEA